MQWEDLKNKNQTELAELLTETRNELRSLQFQAHGRQLKQVGRISTLKRTIARISMRLHDLSRNK